MKKTSIGGQAVIEGVMMRGTNSYTVAVRKIDDEIILDKKPIESFAEKVKLFKLPIFRGMLSFVESMVIGMRTLTYSAEFFEVEEDQKPSKFDQFLERIFGDKLDTVMIGFSVVFAIIMAVGLFMILPLFLSRLFENYIETHWVLNVIEGFIRIGLFLIYIFSISKMKDIQRVFQYHGAEHKTIHCFEHEEELTPENAMKFPRLHKRCGTNFLLIVMIVSIFVFIVVEVDTVWLRMLSRIVLIPIIAGVSYEILKWVGRSESKIVNALTYPGLYLQYLTTREPDSKQIEVAIAALKGVLEDEKEPEASNK